MDRSTFELALRSLAAGRDPQVGDSLVFTPNGWTFTSAEGNIDVIISEDAPPSDPPVEGRIVLWLRVTPLE